MVLFGEKHSRSFDRLNSNINRVNDGIVELKSEIKIIADTMKQGFDTFDDKGRLPEDERQCDGDKSSRPDVEKLIASDRKKFNREFTLVIIEFVALIVLMTVYKFVL